MSPASSPKGIPTCRPRAVLIGLRTAQVDDQAVFRVRNVGDFDRRKLGPAEGAGEPGQKKRTIAHASQAPRAPPDDAPDIGREQRLLAVLCRANGAADSFQRFAHDEVVRRRRRILAA